MRWLSIPAIRRCCVCLKNNQLHLREASKTDADTLSAIHKECFPTYWNIDAFNDFFAVAGTRAWIMEAPEPIAMVVHRVQYEQADIMTIAVLPHWRRKGIARSLLTLAMEKSSQMGAKRMFLDVEDGNVAAMALYEGYGFTVLNRRKNYYRQKDGSHTDALVMKCKLP
jgi:ribosomal-protein-alanine N-acetyltransferase